MEPSPFHVQEEEVFRKKVTMPSPAVCSSLHILNENYKVLLSRDWRGDVSDFCIQRFISLMKGSCNEQSRVPIINDTETKTTYVYVKANGLYFMCTSKFEKNMLALFTFLHELLHIFTSYFGNLEEESILDNFVVIYELLDEVIDNGYPQFTEASILGEYIKTDAHKLVKEKAPSLITDAISWRSEGIMHKKNEIFLDVIEQCDLMISSKGTVVNAEVRGSLKLRTLLSGMPECKLGLNDRLKLGKGHMSPDSVLEDMKFHQCVQLSQFQEDKTISFIPPDGIFELLSYRLTNINIKPLIWCEMKMKESSATRIEYDIKITSQFKEKHTANNITVKIPVRSDVISPEIKCEAGSITYSPEMESLIWIMKSLPGGRSECARIKLSFPSVVEERKMTVTSPVLSVDFEIPYFTISGVQVRYLKVSEKSGYQALPWVRYTTKSGSYNFRT